MENQRLAAQNTPNSAKIAPRLANLGQHRGAVERFRRDRTARLAGCGLERHPEKTRRIELGRFAAANRRKRGAGRPEAFDFLGCTHSCGQTGKGKFQLGRKPIAKRMSRKRKALQRVLRASMHDDRKAVGRWLGQVRNGWRNHYAVPGS